MSEIQSQAPLFVGVDDGFANTNIVVMQGNTVVQQLAIPSRARSGVHGITAIGMEDADALAPSYETEGASFTVGDFQDSETARFDDYPFSNMNRVIVHHALRLAGLAGQDVTIATGLPISRYYKGGKPNAEVIARKEESLVKTVRPVDGSTVANIIAHKVFPEGLAAWIDFAIDDEGNLRASLDETTAVIDIGGRTTDTAVVLPGRKIDHARSGSADIGVLDAIEAVRVALTKKFGVELPVHAIDQALRTKSIKMWGKAQDVSDIVRAATEEVIDRIQREVNRRLGSAVDIDRILLVGGGAHAFREVAKRYPNIEIPEAPEYANARGFAKYLAL